MEETAEAKRARRDTENLGWLAGSSIMPKKQRVIEGVGVSSMMALQAQLYRTQSTCDKKLRACRERERLVSKPAHFPPSVGGSRTVEKVPSRRGRGTTDAQLSADNTVGGGSPGTGRRSGPGRASRAQVRAVLLHRPSPPPAEVARSSPNERAHLPRLGLKGDGVGDANGGVTERAERDRLQMKDDSATGVRSALEKKADLYDKMASGDVAVDNEARRRRLSLPLSAAGSAQTGLNLRAVMDGPQLTFARALRQDERVQVDFEAKRWARHQDRDAPIQRAWDDAGTSGVPDLLGGTGGMMSEDMRREQERRRWEEEAAARLQQERKDEERRRNQREVIGELEAETRAGRDRTALLKAKRANAVEQQREKQKQAFIKQQLQKKRLQGTAAAGSVAKDSQQLAGGCAPDEGTGGGGGAESGGA